MSQDIIRDYEDYLESDDAFYFEQYPRVELCLLADFVRNEKSVIYDQLNEYRELGEQDLDWVIRAKTALNYKVKFIASLSKYISDLDEYRYESKASLIKKIKRLENELSQKESQIAGQKRTIERARGHSLHMERNSDLLLTALRMTMSLEQINEVFVQRDSLQSENLSDAELSKIRSDIQKQQELMV